MPYLNREGVRLYFEDSGGDGVPILLSHGFGASTTMWRGRVEAFKDHYRLFPGICGAMAPPSARTN